MIEYQDNAFKKRLKELLEDSDRELADEIRRLDERLRDTDASDGEKPKRSRSITRIDEAA